MDLVILAIITAYIFYRLSKNLGKIDEEEKNEIHKKLFERKKQIEEILNRAQQNSSAQTQNKEEKIIKISFRSQYGFDVNQFARDYFHGGGHSNAAGGKSDLSMEDTIAKFEELVTKIKI